MPSRNAYLAMEGFHQMGMETVLVQTKEEIRKSALENIIVGGVGFVKNRLEELGKPIQDIDYPKELEKYFGRKIWKGSIKDLQLGKIAFPVFIKPIEGKKFCGEVVKDEVDFIGKITPYSDFQVFYSEPIKIAAEYRCYIRYGKILDIKRYKGVFDKFYSYKTIQSVILDYVSAPAAYGIDFGVTDKGETIIVEVNDGYSLGNYGLDPLLYAKLLSARWAEITGTKDECAFDFI